MSRRSESTEFLKECIADSLIKLLQDKPIEHITIDEIIACAGVGRATYFRNFKSKEDVLVFKLIICWERYSQEHNIRERNKFDTQNARHFFEYNYSIRDILDTIYAAGMSDAVFKAFQKIMLPPMENDTWEWYRENFYSCGLFGLLDSWIRRKYSESPAQMAQIILEIIQVHKN